MRTHIKLAFAVLACFLQGSCTPGKPSAEDAKQAIKDYYATQRQSTKDVTIIRFGESGKGDFSAPGSQDTYWPVEFDLPAEKVIDAGSLQASPTAESDLAKKIHERIQKKLEKKGFRESAAGDHGVAQIYRDKMGRWKVARIEP
jgi:hypothetical protein